MWFEKNILLYNENRIWFLFTWYRKKEFPNFIRWRKKNKLATKMNKRWFSVLITSKLENAYTMIHCVARQTIHWPVNHIFMIITLRKQTNNQRALLPYITIPTNRMNLSIITQKINKYQDVGFIKHGMTWIIPFTFTMLSRSNEI